MQLSKLRDPLIDLNRVINLALFLSTLLTIAEKPRKFAAGRKLIPVAAVQSAGIAAALQFGG
ncbi:MAG: hypothetical protein ABIR84_02655 [Candidatus Nitrotoga sp.]